MTARFTLQEVLAATRGECNAQGTKLDFEGISTDTRTLAPGVLYIALSGERFDGHDYVQEAIRLGAAGVIVSQPVTVETGATVVEVVNTRIALQDLARFHRCRFQLPLIAVTGSNGKTSTKDMIAAVLTTKLNVLRTEANFNNEIGLSQTLLRLDESHQAAVVEMGMRGRGEIAELASIALPTIGVVTNVGETHLERLGTVANIAAAKAELVEALPISGFAVLNADDNFVHAMQQKTAAQIRTFAVMRRRIFRRLTLSRLSRGYPLYVTRERISFRSLSPGRVDTTYITHLQPSRSVACWDWNSRRSPPGWLITSRARCG